MRIAVLGTGTVGQAVADKLVALGHEVAMGSRTADNPNAVEWAARAGRLGRAGTFADAAAFGELLVNATAGNASVLALTAAGEANLAGKVLIDIANPLDYSAGMPPSLDPVNTDSLGEQIQSAFPELRVVKTLNTMRFEVMVDPARIPGKHNVFVCGNDQDAKKTAGELLAWFGWPEDSVIDLGDITTSRGTEMLLPVWLRLWGALGHTDFNFHIQSAR